MNFRDLIELATDAPRRHGLRSALFVAGIAVGVAAVLLLTALGEGARHFVVREFVGVGTNLVIVMPGKVETTGLPAVPGGTTRDLKVENTSATSPQVINVNSPGTLPISDITIKNCRIVNGSTGSSAVVIDSLGYWDNMRVENNRSRTRT